MTLPKETPKWQNHFVSERYAQLDDMYKLSRKCYPALLRVIWEEMEREEISVMVDRNRRLMNHKLNK